MNKKVLMFVGVGLMLVNFTGCLSCSHYRYAKRAEAARTLPEGVVARPGRIYFVSFPENCLAASILGWNPNVGHASLLTRDGTNAVKQYDYGWFVGYEGRRPEDAIGYVDESAGYGVVRRKLLPETTASKSMTDTELAKIVLEGMGRFSDGKLIYGDKIEMWAKDVPDIGIAERYMEQLAEDKDRGSMAWRCWQIGGYRCGNITRQAFDAARGEYHWLDLLWGGFPGADAPSIGTEKTVYVNGK